jgi:hypothetical protein
MPSTHSGWQAILVGVLEEPDVSLGRQHADTLVDGIHPAQTGLTLERLGELMLRIDLACAGLAQQQVENDIVTPFAFGIQPLALRLSSNPDIQQIAFPPLALVVQLDRADWWAIAQLDMQRAAVLAVIRP